MLQGSSGFRLRSPRATRGRCSGEGAADPLPPLQLPAPAMAEHQLKRRQQEAEEVTEIMLDNCTKVLDREGKVSNLDERADELRKQSSAFTKTTKTKKKFWKNMGCKLILMVLAMVGVLAIITATIL